jgi:DNA-binding transcriptional LysR family regulator
MSQSLASLRTLFGDELLVRSGNRMVPTTRAEALGPALRRSLAGLQHVLDAGTDFEPAGATGTLRIATGDHLAALVLPPLLALLTGEAPQLEVRMTDLIAGDTERLLREDTVDLVLGPPVRTSAEIATKSCFTDEFACLVPAEMVAPRSARMGLRQYVRASHIVVSPSGRGDSAVDRALAERGRKRHIAARVTSFVLAPVVAARAGLVLTAPRASLVAVSRDLPMRILRPPLQLPGLDIAVHQHRQRKDEPRMRWYNDALVRALDAAGVL